MKHLDLVSETRHARSTHRPQTQLGRLLFASARSIGGRRRSRSIAAALAGAVVLFVLFAVADCGNIDDTPRAWRAEVRAW